MALHTDSYAGGFPIWVWARIRRDDLVRHLRRSAADKAGTVMLTLSIPRERLLLTDYLVWHDVLNGCPSLPVSCPRCVTRFCDDADCLDEWHESWSEAWAARIPRDGEHVELDWWDWPVKLQSELFATWSAVHQTRSRWPVQGCVEQIEAAWVTAVRRPRCGAR